MNVKIHILGATLLIAFIWQPAYAERVLRCESQNNSYQFCPIRKVDTRYISLSRQISKSSCQQGRTYGINRRGIWVDNGCRADFIISSGGYAHGNYVNPIYSGTSSNNYDGYDRGYYNRPHQGPAWNRKPRPRGEPRRHPRNLNYDRSNDVSKGGQHFRVAQTLRPGNSWVGPRIDQPSISTVRVLLRRLNPALTDTHLSIGYNDNQQLGAQQVDSEKLHWLTFQVGNNPTRGRNFVVTSHSGAVYVDRVIVVD